jgi:hypothetical protein
VGGGGCGSESSVYLHLHNKCGAQQYLHSVGTYLGINIVGSIRKRREEIQISLHSCIVDYITKGGERRVLSDL